MKFNALKTKFFLALFAILVSASLTGSVYSQSGTSSVSGAVVDQAGAAVPGATVTLFNPSTGQTRTVTSGDDGKYNFPSISPGTYRLEVTAQNFKKVIKSNVQALVDLPVEVNIALEPGDVTATVDVTTDTIESIVNTQDASLGNNFQPEQITQLPSDLRRVTDLLTLQPGVTREGYVAGNRSDQTNVTLDGVDINDQQTGGRTDQFDTSQNTVLRLTTEAVQEFRITTANPNANQGRSSGAQISLVTKSGTNNFHGSAFYFYRPTALSANTFFNNLAGVERPSLARDVFGGSIGGPIIKDRFFFFYSYEGQREQSGVSVVRVVPLAHLGQGQLRFQGRDPQGNSGPGGIVTINRTTLNQIVPVGLNPAAISALASAAAQYQANDTTVGDGINTGGFRFNAPVTINENTHIARFDFNINDKQSLFLRGNYQNDLSQNVSYFPDTPAPSTWSHPYGFVVGHNWTINNNMVNNFRYGLTRQAFTVGGDSSDNAVSFRFVFQPRGFSRDLSRITPVQNFTDDFTWIKGNHTMQFGGNVRIIRNERVDFGNAFDSAVTNPSFYDESGAVVDEVIRNAGYTIGAGQTSIVQNALTALIGRFSQYSGSYTFDLDGTPLAPGTPTERTFATEEYDVYGQDVWRPTRNLTLTFGLRYALSRPVYEKNGFQVVPTEPLGRFFERRRQSAAGGVPLNDLINYQLGGPVNDGPGFYSMDKNNWQPSVAVAWEPNFENGFLKFLFGNNNKSVLRGGFRIMNDYFGQQLAVSFNNLSFIGFTSDVTISANTFNVSDRPAPLFTGFNQNVRSLPGLPAPALRFDIPADQAQRIEIGLDATLKAPTHYTWNATYGRELPAGIYFEASYVGRAARNLLASRDIMALNNLVDPVSGLDWYTAAGRLVDLRNANTPIASVAPIPYFENLFPNYRTATLSPTQRIYRLLAREFVNNDPNQGVIGGFDIFDYTFVQLILDDRGIYPNMFFHPQIAAFSAFSTVGSLDYHGGVFSLRQRLGDALQYDINYTFSKSLDNASGLQTGANYGSTFILNPLRPEDNRSVSDYDIRHIINANFLFQVPIGRGRAYFNNMHPVAEVLLGGWQLTGVYRYNTGLPLSTPFDSNFWATNWNVQSNSVRVRALQASLNRDTQNLFSDPVAAYQSLRSARPGETGDRNVLRLPGYQTMDLGLGKSFTMPWSENHKLQIRGEVFNVSNIQYFNADNSTRSTYGTGVDPYLGQPSPDFGKIFSSIQGSPRRFQFGVRYEF